MVEPEAAGFWSYTHADNDAESGRILRLAERVQAEYGLITGGDIRIFIDREDLEWGEQWRRRIDAALSATTFFIPIVTPRYFRSEECRKEMLTFAAHAKSLDVLELLLPLHYIDVPGLADIETEDDAMVLVSERQWQDWRTLRLAEEDSAQYRQAVNTLAVRLRDIRSAVSRPEPAAGPAPRPEDQATAATGDAPGILDVLAEGEQAFPRWSGAISRLLLIMENMGELVESASTKMQQSDAQGKGFGGRLAISRQLAVSLAPLADEMKAVAHDYSSDLRSIDAAVLTLIRQVEAEAEEFSDDDVREARDFFGSVLGLHRAMQGNGPAFKEYVKGLDVMATTSRDLRPVVNELKIATRDIADGNGVTAEWARRIEELPSALQPDDET